MSGTNLSNVTKCLFGEYLSKDGMMISDWGGNLALRLSQKNKGVTVIQDIKITVWASSEVCVEIIRGPKTVCMLWI